MGEAKVAGLCEKWKILKRKKHDSQSVRSKVAEERNDSETACVGHDPLSLWFIFGGNDPGLDPPKAKEASWIPHFAHRRQR